MAEIKSIILKKQEYLNPSELGSLKIWTPIEIASENEVGSHIKLIKNLPQKT